MKEWSKSWKRSKQPRKQRKYAYNAPLHIVRKMMSVRLAKELKAKYSKRNIPIRTGDKVKIMVGQHKGKVTKVNKVDLVHKRIYLNDVHTIKRDGTKIPVSINSSNLMILELNLDDKLRKESLERK